MADTGKKKKTPGLHYLTQFIAAVKAKLKSGNLTESDLNEIVKQTRSHAGGKAKAEKMKPAVASLVAVEKQFAEDDGFKGLVICFYPSADAAAQLAIPSGELPEDLHLTLCYLGDASQFGEMAIADVLVAMRNMAGWQTPLAGEVSGIGRFIGDGEEDVFYASVDIPGLNEFRADLVRRLASCGTPVNAEHGFDPHITLAYLPKGDPTPDYDMSDIALRFDRLTVKIADRRVDLQMLPTNNYSEVADLCADGQKMRLFIEQPERFAEPPATFNYLPKPGVYTSPRYGEITITRERNERFVENFRNKVYQEKLPIDCEHDLAQSGATGWITLLTVNEDGSVDASAEWTDRGIDLIKKDRFKYFSPAWFDQWTDPVNPDTKIKDVAIGGALTVRPFFKEKALQPLVANESGELQLASSMTVDQPGKGFSEIFFTSLAPKTTDDAGAPATTSEGATDMTTAATGQPNVTELQTKLTAAETLAATEKARADAAEAKLAEQRTAGENLTTAAEQITQLTEKVAGLEKDKRASQFGEISKDWIGERQGHIDMLEFLATKTEKGQESPEFKAYVESQNATAARLKSADLFTERGSSAPAANSAAAMIDAKAKQLSEASGGTLTFEAAMAQVVKDQPQLYSDYLREQSGTITV